MHLHEFISANRNELIARTRAKVSQRPWPSVSPEELETGIPLFLSQLAETLRLENTKVPFPSGDIGSSATTHGGDLLAKGFTVSQVVHDYGDVCQAVTELAIEQKATLSTEEFHTLNRCLDTAIAEAVTEYGRLQHAKNSRDESERQGRVAHELRNALNTAMLAFQAIRSGQVAAGGSTAAVLNRSLTDLRDLIDGSMSAVRMGAGIVRHDRISVHDFIADVAAAARLYTENHEVRLSVSRVSDGLVVSADRPLLTSALMNLLQNAFKHTRKQGRVTLRTRVENGHVLIEVEDECGGLADDESETEMFRPFGDRRKHDRSSLGLGLSISRRAVQANGGEIRTRNVPDKGCVFIIELPSVA